MVAWGDLVVAGQSHNLPIWWWRGLRSFVVAWGCDGVAAIWRDDADLVVAGLANTTISLLSRKRVARWRWKVARWRGVDEWAVQPRG